MAKIHVFVQPQLKSVDTIKQLELKCFCPGTKYCMKDIFVGRRLVVVYASLLVF